MSHMMLIIHSQNKLYIPQSRTLVTSPSHIPQSHPPVMVLVTSPSHVTLLPYILNNYLKQILSEPSGSVGRASDFWARGFGFNVSLGKKKTNFQIVFAWNHSLLKILFYRIWKWWISNFCLIIILPYHHPTLSSSYLIIVIPYPSHLITTIWLHTRT